MKKTTSVGKGNGQSEVPISSSAPNVSSRTVSLRGESLRAWKYGEGSVDWVDQFMVQAVCVGFSGMKFILSSVRTKRFPSVIK